MIDDEEALDEMLSHFPARDLDEPVTKDHLRAEMAALDQRMTIGFAAVDQRMTGGFAAAHSDTMALEHRMRDRYEALDAKMNRWFASTTGIILAAILGLAIRST